jgi:hypothetical protein
MAFLLARDNDELETELRQAKRTIDALCRRVDFSRLQAEADRATIQQLVTEESRLRELLHQAHDWLMLRGEAVGAAVIRTGLTMLFILLLAVPAAAVPIFDVGTEALVEGPLLITPALLVDWQPRLMFPDGFPAGLSVTEEVFICPADYRCIYSALGWAVLVEHDISVGPGTGGLGLNNPPSTYPVPEPPTLYMMLALVASYGLILAWRIIWSGTV